MNLSPGTDAIHSQGIKKKTGIKGLRTTRKHHRQSVATCRGDEHQERAGSTTRSFCEGHLSIGEVTRSSLHITAAYLFSETPSLAVLKAGRKSKADWVKRCLFRWHK